MCMVSALTVAILNYLNKDLDNDVITKISGPMILAVTLSVCIGCFF